MVHHRLNERETNPNPHINFITSLPAAHPEDSENARQLLRALAAQVRPIMKAHGFEVNSLEEYEYNKVFAGRNWNSGETVELVLRNQGGAFQSVSWIMSTLCHELAHIKHMNHGPEFQALWRGLNTEVRALQMKGYYGDGYWSSGTRLSDSARVGGQGIDAGELPEYMCGGAHSRKRPTSTRRRRAGVTGQRQSAYDTTPSEHTGRQTAKKRKAGARLRGDFGGEGHSLVDDVSNGIGIGFRKKAGSKRAREERALAIEQRVQALKLASTFHSDRPGSSTENHSEDESDAEELTETDADRLQTLVQSEEGADLAILKGRQLDLRDFFFPEQSIPSVGSNVASGTDCNGMNTHGIVQAGKGRNNIGPCDDDDLAEIADGPSAKLSKAALKRALISKEQRPPGTDQNDNLPAVGSGSGETTVSTAEREWPCPVCTLINRPLHLACSACGTIKGDVDPT